MGQEYCKFVDVFYGNGQTDRFFEDGLASKWFYIKALCGNTTPHAVLPFGKISVGAYSGGYPTGYGTHYPNSCGGIQKTSENKVARGFSHLHQSGTGAIQYYYNYAIVTPFYGKDISVIGKTYALKNEQGRPGYYKANIQDIECEFTVDGGVAIHKYGFGSNGGRLAVDFSNDGLSSLFSSRYYASVRNPELKIQSNDTVVFSGIFSGIKLYFCVKVESVNSKVQLFSQYNETKEKGANELVAPYGAIFDFDGNSVVVRVAFSTLSYEKAVQEVENSQITFEDATKKAGDKWEDALSKFKIDTTDNDLKVKFYSNLYHSLIKPSDMAGESVLGVSGDTVTDFATFWDQYKTTLPLIYTAYPEMSEKIVKSILNISRTLGKIPCSFGLSDIFPCEEQAKALGILTLCDAYHMGVKGASADIIDECTVRELERKDFEPFIKDGYFERYTHILDVTDACLCVEQITNNNSLKEKLSSLSQFWRNAYGDDGLMSEKSKYYEGDRYTYSFRIQKNMKDRVDLAGGKEKFCQMLDDFFGFGKQSVKQLTYIGAGKDIDEAKHHRFEGFNNECDMETPYAYIYADRHDRLCEIVRECVHRSFGLGENGLPGNNDSGGLSATFVWNTLGIFPISGSGNFLIGAPQIDGEEIRLASGKVLTILAQRKCKTDYIVGRVYFNGKELNTYEISAKEIMQGGILQFYMKGKEN